MSAGIHTNDLRFAFVEKTAGEVGDGTAYPVPATLDQIAEIFYRVRNTIISGGEWSGVHTNFPDTYPKYVGFFNANSPPDHNYHKSGSSEWSQEVRRGYSFNASSPNVGWLEHHCDPVYSSPIGGDFHDAKDEFCMWPDDGVNSATLYGGGFNHLAKSSTFGGLGSDSESPFIYGPYFKATEVDDSIRYYGSDCRFVVYPQVAFIGADSPFDPAATLYPAIVFTSFSVYFVSFSSIFADDGEGAGTAEVVLSSGTLVIPIRLNGDGYTLTLTSSPRLTVTEWWPYAKDSPAVPVWNSATGEKL